KTVGLDANLGWDSWEIFLALALYALRDGGRIAMVLPDTIFSPEKERSRRLLLGATRIERLHSLGPDWFGPNVRMGTVIVQARKGPSDQLLSDIKSLLLTGKQRREAIAGTLPLSQLEATTSRSIPQDRCVASPHSDIEVFRSSRDDVVMNTMESNSDELSSVCDRGRGEEMSKSGLIWICPSCMNPTAPGRKK